MSGRARLTFPPFDPGVPGFRPLTFQPYLRMPFAALHSVRYSFWRKGVVSLLGVGMGWGVVGAAPRAYDHVVVVIEENHSFSQVIGNRTSAPYINSLADGGVNFVQFHAITHPSQPNYIHLFSGDNQGVVDDNRPTTYPWVTPNLGAALLMAGKTFGGYSEDQPAIGDADSTGTDGPTGLKLYRRKHNPWANWQAAADPAGPHQLPPAVNMRWSDFPTDYSLLPHIAMVVPNEQNDMHDGTVRMGDDWVNANLSAYAEWARTHNSLLIVTFDEDNFSGPNRIPTVFYGAGLRPGVNATVWTLHNLLRTLGDMHGALPPGRAAQVRPIVGVFDTDPVVEIRRFQAGRLGYAEAVDASIRADSPDTPNAAGTTLAADLDADAVTAGNQPQQAMVRFGGLFGLGADQIPPDATILSAKLILMTGSGTSDDSNDLVAAHRVLIPWSVGDTWNSLVEGIAADGGDAVAEPSFTYQPELENAPAIFDVTGDLEAWQSGAPNHGWVLIADGPDGWTFRSTENATAANRPLLEIALTRPPVTSFAQWQLRHFAGDPAGPDAHPLADPDADGCQNLVEYATGGNPLAASAEVPLSALRTSEGFEFNAIGAAHANDVALRVQVGSATTGWLTAATIQGGIVTVDSGLVSHRGSTPLQNGTEVHQFRTTGAGGRQFIRLVAEL